MLVFERLQSTQKILVVDIYDPMHLEQLEQAKELSRARWELNVRDATKVLNNQLARGDFFMCASERQRVFWLGQLAALGRLNPDVYEHDLDLRKLIDVVPFGLSETPPIHTRKVLKGVYPGIPDHAKILLWSGGLYNWFDPHTLIRAVAQLSEEHPEIVLFFQGVKHPHPGVPEMEIVETSRTLAAELGVLGRKVIFNDSWVEFADRQNYLLEADIGVSTHHEHIETTFSFRTRILDYLWADLPMVVTEGDHFGDLVKRNQLGVAVKAGDVSGLAQALEQAVYDESFREKARNNIAKVREEYFWSRALRPLLAFVADAHHAADNVGGRASLANAEKLMTALGANAQQSKFRRAREILKAEGIGGVIAASRRKLRNEDASMKPKETT